jgi:hypothetical protein
MVSLENFWLGSFEFTMTDKVMVFVFVFVAIFLDHAGLPIPGETPAEPAAFATAAAMPDGSAEPESV